MYEQVKKAANAAQQTQQETNAQDHIIETAHAKINLSLDVTGQRADGYHEVCMIMQSLALCDDIVLERIPAECMTICDQRMQREGGQQADCARTLRSPISLEITDERGQAKGEGASIPCDQANLMWRAAMLMCETYGIRDGVSMRLLKRIPAAAGLAGGSADAAAVLRGMNRLFELGLSDAALAALGARLGADIPYCVYGGTMLAEGIGEVLRALPAAPFFHVLLAKPLRGVSTKEVYQALDALPAGSVIHPDTEAALLALREGNRAALCAALGNVLERVTIPAVPEIDEIKLFLRPAGADGVLMSGSGPTVFGLFRERDAMQKTAQALRESALSKQLSDVVETEIWQP